MSTEPFVFIGSFVGAATAVGAATGLLWRRFRGMAHLVDDLLGEPARPGVAGRPGVMERLHRQERITAALHMQLQQLQAQVAELVGKVSDE